MGFLFTSSPLKGKGKAHPVIVFLLKVFYPIFKLKKAAKAAGG